MILCRGETCKFAPGRACYNVGGSCGGRSRPGAFAPAGTNFLVYIRQKQLWFFVHTTKLLPPLFLKLAVGGQVIDVDRYAGIREAAPDDRLDLRPTAAGQAAADAGHMDAGACLSRTPDHQPQALLQRLVADRGLGLAARADSVLGNHIGDS